MAHTVITVEKLSKCFNRNAAKVTTTREHLNGALRSRTQHSENLFWALRDVTFELKSGETLALVGRNGAGKSVLLKILAQVTRPTSGRAEVRGRVAPLLQLGAGFHPDLTGRENIYFNGALLGMRRREIDARVDEIVAFSEVSEFLQTPLKFYSSGMRMRLAFSVAAHLDRDIFILDEALAVGDIGFREKCLTLLHELARQGRTILLVGHGDQLIERLCNTAILLDHGRMVASGHPAEVNRTYQTLRNSSLTPEALAR